MGNNTSLSAVFAQLRNGKYAHKHSFKTVLAVTDVLKRNHFGRRKCFLAGGFNGSNGMKAQIFSIAFHYWLSSILADVLNWELRDNIGVENLLR